MSFNPANKKNMSYDIILILRPKEGGAKSVTGLVDTRLFTGGNRLHVKMDTQTCLWYFEYDSGVLPVPFRQRFTGLQKALDFVKDYYDKRNIEIAEIID